MYGRCDSAVPGAKEYCQKNIPAPPVTDPSHFKLLHDNCPSLSMAGINKTLACCDKAQLEYLTNNLLQAQSFLSRCPACLRNFYNMWCQFTCSPNQANFLIYEQFNIAAGVYATHAEMYQSTEYISKILQSCVDVTYPSSNAKSLDFLCGGHADQCTPRKWLDFLGDPTNGAPFKIHTHLNETLPAPDMKNLDILVHTCNDPFLSPLTGRNVSACNCMDCKKSCKVIFIIMQPIR
jgi:Niemann-Pick C1 protein